MQNKKEINAGILIIGNEILSGKVIILSFLSKRRKSFRDPTSGGVLNNFSICG